MKRILLVLTISLFSLNLSAQSDKQEILKVAFLETGTLLVDGKKSTKKALIAKLENIQKKKGKVYYYQSPKVKQMDLMKALNTFKLLSKYKVPVIAYSDKDFKKRKGS